MTESKLQPLRIPPGWSVVLNNFVEVGPDFSEQDMSGTWWNFKEDLFQVSRGGVMLDLGWYPEFQSCGAFRLKVVFGDNWDKHDFVFESTVRTEVVAEIERLLLVYQNQPKS